MNLKKHLNKILCSPFILVIRLYQIAISPLIPPSCIYYPNCSEYAKQAYLKHGLIKGTYLSVTRLLRCHPFRQGGVDEVPEFISLMKSTKNG